jgi:hypothetical protein
LLRFLPFDVAADEFLGFGDQRLLIFKRAALLLAAFLALN